MSGDLGPDTRALLDAARDAHDPTAADRARVRGKIATRIGAAAFGTTIAVTATSSTVRTALKVGIGAAVGGALLLAGFWWKSSHEPVTVTPVTNAPAVAVREPSPPPVDLGPAAVPVESLAPAPTATQEKKIASPSPASADPQSQSQSTLDAELSLLTTAKKAINDGDPARSLAILDEHQKKFPNGILVEERASTRIFALCAAGNTAEARTSAQDFLAKYPRSPSAPRVRASCGAP